jgi:hypothetical protein
LILRKPGYAAAFLPVSILSTHYPYSSGFIWLTDQESMFNNGISDKIWIMGGDTEKGSYSILGPTLTFKNPLKTPK